jgi:protocatechuate 3,4-dioxygenase beta subunit
VDGGTGARLARRRFLQVGGGAALAALLASCGDDGGDGAATTSAPTDPPGTPVPPATATTDGGEPALTVADFAGITPCLVVPHQVEGPFYLRADLVRRDITEGLSGHPLQLGLRVVDAACAPIPGAAVDVWHADVDGDYSGFVDGQVGRDGDGGPGTTFLRGTQVTDADGIVAFATLYPGWYPGRTVHVHLKVELGDAEVLTSQLYFPDDVTDEVLAGGAYADRGERDTTNGGDAIAEGFATNGTLLTMSAQGAGHRALAVVGVAP